MKRITIIIMLLFAIIWLAGLVVFNYKINNFVIDEKTKTDAIVVLTGGRHRLAEAVNLLDKGMAEHLFISGVQKDISLRELSKRYNIKLSAEQEITLDKIATNTHENARETILWVKSNNIKSIRLVTSNYHIMRSLIEFRRWNTEVNIILHPVFSEKIASSWWKSVDSFCFLAREYNKLLYALVRAKFCDV